MENATGPVHTPDFAHTDAEVVFGDLGALLLDAGMSVTDVRASLEQVRDATAPEEALAFAVLPQHVLVSRPRTAGATTIGASTGAELTFRQSAHASRLARRLEVGKLSLDQVPAHVERIRGLPRRHPTLQWLVGGGLLSTGLAMLFRCPWWAIVLALLVGAVVGAISTLMSRFRPAAAIVPFVASFVSTVLVGAADAWLDLGPVPLFAVCAPIALLVPGALITNALLELTAADIVTGAARLTYGIIMLGFMSAGIFAGGALTGLRIDPDSAALVGQAAGVTADHGGWQALPPLWLSWIGVVFLAIGIGLAFGAGFRLTVVSVLVMTCTYAALVALTPFTGNTVATGIAAALLFVAARLLERVTLAVPATVSFQPAFLLLVPGTVGLVAMTSFDTDALAAAPMIFVSLCIGTKVGALVADAARITHSAPAPAA